MMNFYSLTDDKEIIGRWVVDDPDANNEDIWSWHYTSGQRIGLKSVACKIARIGKSLDFTLTVLQVPLLAKTLADAIRNVVAAGDVEWISAKVGQRQEEYEIMNVIRVVDCLDEDRTRSVERWTKDSIRPELDGRFRSVIDMRVDPTRIPEDVHIFRVWGWEGPLIASETLIEAMKRAPHNGMKLFERVT